ncbi:MAG: 3-phosphoserine/phosphohydroxythreonine transaminase [Sedimentisphaerales bacterium]|nr:3-phosphoserine/phosphohydroxythreonine transaminase [Sedimentisphaerales bacterium]MBN2842532.1 3-phosphoserine/phosphohydroxythreonine transaminase [Sedimentisphaerales bacterium]
MTRAHNFYAGPSAIPAEVLQEAAQEMLDYKGTGTSIMETSHRSSDFDAVHNEAINLVKELMGLGDDFEVLMLQGGASTQFALIPMNFLSSDASADYINTGTWSKKAIKEAKLFGKVNIAANTELEGGVFRAIPKQADLKLDPKAVYCHITSNNTIYGTQWSQFPNTGNVPLVGDMSSDIMSRVFDPKPFGLIYAGAQKNLGPSGLALVIIRKDMVAKIKSGLPTMFNYKTHIDENSLYNTPPSFGVYMMGKVLKWVKANGGVAGMEKINNQKAATLYSAIDNSNGFYTNVIAKEDRSRMNIVFNLKTEELEKEFLKLAKSNNMLGLAGHRSIGGVRASIYNAVSQNSVNALCDLMKDFASKKS